MTKKFIFSFGGGRAEGSAAMKALLGGKGANLAEMTNIGLPVPPGFTISTDICTYYYTHNKKYPKDFQKKVLDAHGTSWCIIVHLSYTPQRPFLHTPILFAGSVIAQ